MPSRPSLWIGPGFSIWDLCWWLWHSCFRVSPGRRCVTGWGIFCVTCLGRGGSIGDAGVIEAVSPDRSRIAPRLDPFARRLELAALVQRDGDFGDFGIEVRA